MKALGADYLWVDLDALPPEGRASLDREAAGGRLTLIHEERAELCLPPKGPPPSAEGATQTYRLTAGRSLGQSFTAAADGLCQVEMLLSGRARPDNPPVDLTLTSGAGSPDSGPERQTQLAGPRIVNDTWYAFGFAPFADSRGALFTLTLTSPASRTTNAVASWWKSSFEPGENLSAGRAPLRTAAEVRTESGQATSARCGCSCIGWGSSDGDPPVAQSKADTPDTVHHYACMRVLLEL
ncbi:MAG: hypothetical protein NTZ05_14445 [Chloroflexi bacterium]|nr:hypothetical protein [Chloroflexota bacterium]